jgi:hypothetical protein
MAVSPGHEGLGGTTILVKTANVIKQKQSHLQVVPLYLDTRV